MSKSFFIYVVVVVLVLFAITACTNFRLVTNQAEPSVDDRSAIVVKPFVAQVVGLQWLNPLQRKDYPTQWQLLWTLGLVKPNISDEMVRSKPEKYSKLQSIGSIAAGNEGSETLRGYYRKYVEEIFDLVHDVYYSDPEYFYNVHSVEKKSRWRELAGIHIEFALPEERLDSKESADFVREYVSHTFNIGNIYAPTLWTRATPPMFASPWAAPTPVLPPSPPPSTICKPIPRKPSGS